MAGRIAVVDADNRFLRWEERRTIHEQRFVHRSIHVLVFDTRGRLLIQRRHRDKQTYPGWWDSSCAGHVDESDYTGAPDDDLDAVYRNVARRELEEELGVTAPVTELERFAPPADGWHYEQIRLFRAESDGPFRLQEEEVEEYRLVTPAEYDAMDEGGEPLTGTLRFFVEFLRRSRAW